jgi:hypothetical protein
MGHINSYTALVIQTYEILTLVFVSSLFLVFANLLMNFYDKN